MTQVEEDKVMVLMDGKDPFPSPALFLDLCALDPVPPRNIEPLQVFPLSCFASHTEFIVQSLGNLVSPGF